MRLKRLTLHGFKSFADRTEFEFDHGLTGIIGPNGCGKSNVVDAVKWVLGDQRPTSLRGKEMLDVIFNGAEGRPAMGCSEVTLVLERAAELPEGGSQLGSAARDESNGKPVELSVGRRLYRSGESEYLLNNRIVRLKDVREAMMDTGLGVGAYSVMEQGRIDAVLSANPEDRRMIFDEAAGISRYKLRRKEALRKLDRTEQNLARVKDLRGEKATRVRSLKIQATRARNYRETDERLMAIRVALAMSRSAEIRETLGEHEAAIAEADASLQRASRARDATRRVLVDGERELRELSGCQAGIKDLLAELRAEERSRREALANGEERLERLARLRERAGGEVERVTGLAAQSLADALELEKGLEELARTLASAEDAYPGLETEAQSAKQALAQLHAERDRLQQALLACLHERTRAKNCVREEELKAQARDARRARIHAQLGELKGRLEESRRQGNSEWQVLLDLEERCRRVAGRIARESETGTRLESRRDELMERVRALGNERSALASQLELLEELEASQQGLDEAARELLADGPGILGRLVEQLECPLEVSAALEAALGSRVQALLAADPPCEINRVLDALAKRQGGGHLELLEVPPDTGETTPPAADPGELPPDGRPLLEFCRLGAQVREPLTRLLGGVRLVRDLETARRLAAQEGGGTIYVTPRGELCEGAWISGGKSEAAAGLLQRKSALERLRTELERANAAHAELDAEEEDLARRWERLRGQRERLARLAEALDKKHASVEHRLQARQQREGELEEELRMDRVELDELQGEHLESLARLVAPLLDSMLLGRREDLLETEQKTLNKRLRELDASVHQSQDRLAGLQADKAKLEAELRGLRERRELMERERKGHEQRLVELEAEIASQDLETEELSRSLSTWRVELYDYACRAGFVEGRVHELDQRLLELEKAADDRRADADESEGLLERTREQRSELLLGQRELSFEIRQLEEDIRSRYRIELARLRGDIEGHGLWADGEILGPPLPPSGPVRERILGSSLAGPLAPPDFYRSEQELPRLWELESFDRQEAEQEREVLESRMQRMGAVNLAAEGELQAAQEEFETLERDWQDLEESRKQLIETLRRINEESRALFEKTFDEARRNFQDVFRMLFQGGKADIELVDADDPLESGIEIYARPPGKELRSIRLLSGGERSLTALAILFGVFKVKPSPFCVLDEVDAALDETNVERFLRVLEGFVVDTQYVVVTHHKRTMAECQVLYGVTMPRRGVSSRMAVSLRDVESGEVDRILEAGPEAEARRAGVEAAVPESADLRSKAPSGKGTR